MYSHIKAIPWNSIRVKLVLGLLGVAIPLIALLIYMSYYSVNVIHNQVAVSNKNMISIQMRQIDNQLAEIERHLVNLSRSEVSVLTMKDAVPDHTYMMAKSDVSRKLSSDLSVYPYIDGLFVYSLPRHDFVEAYKGSMTYNGLLKMRDYLQESSTSQNRFYGMEANWQLQEIEGSYYAIKVLRDDNISIGSWVSLKTLMSPMSVLNTGETGAMLFVDAQGKPLYNTKSLQDETLDFTHGFNSYYMSGKDKDYLIVGETSKKADISMVAVIPDKLTLENLPYLKKTAAILSAFAVLLLPVSLWFLRKVLLRPLQKIVQLMRRIGEGNFNLRIEKVPTAPEEFQLVYRTLDQMVSQIEKLKIDVYEEQLSKQRAELKQLQLQINPHFFMNSLNILYHLAQVKRYELIQEMTICLVQYFRYMFHSNNQALVLLKDELQHTRNYLRIQQLRLPNQFESEIHVPDYLLETPVPPLMLQTIVENTIKHAVRADVRTMLVIEAILDDLAEEPTVCLTVRDTGDGFSDEVLEAIRCGRQGANTGRAHIGLWNVRERLRLQYGNGAVMDCYNDDPHGAVVELFIPLSPGQDGKEDANASCTDRG
ncbi:sensor histidine kinase [Paenibacillus sp. Dod16]|uniref:sensor histidine kinase n=1 Tax=Paenibacillus sp. Dod16 TaxID=3416392 RepID=UPI003CEC50CE